MSCSPKSKACDHGAAVAALLFWLVPFPAAAQDEGDGMSLRLPLLGESVFQFTSTTTAEWRGVIEGVPPNPYNDHFLALQQRLDLALQGEEVRVSVRIDGFLPLDESECPPGMESLCFIEPDLRPNVVQYGDDSPPWSARLPERVSIVWQHDPWTLELGDAYTVFGRGIALAFRKDDALGVDNTLRGVRAAVDRRRWVGQFVAGMSNPQNIDPITLAVNQDPEDIVVGLDLGTRIGANDEIETGGHLVHTWFEADPATESDFEVDIIGWRIAAPSLFDGQLSLVGEADALRRIITPSNAEERRDLGRAVYGSAQLALERLTVLLEWKDYRDFTHAATTREGQPHRIYSSMPTFERETERVRAPYNQRGAGLRIDYGFLPSTWSVTAAGTAYGLEEHGQDPWDGILVTHGWAAVRRQSAPDDEGATWMVEAVGGYRRETYLTTESTGGSGAPEEGDLDWEVIHGEIDGTLAIGDHSFELRVEHRAEQRRRSVVLEPGNAYREYTRGGVSLTWSFRGQWIVSPSIRWNDEKDMVQYTEWFGSFPTQDLYPYLEVKWVFHEGSFVRIAGGRRPGGPICSGGVCRDLPPFEGVLAELVFRR